MDKIDPYNVMNKTCKSCVLHSDHTKRITLERGRLAGIQADAINGVNQICHNNKKGEKKICRGIRNWQIDMYYKLKIITEPTEKCLLETMENTLGINTKVVSNGLLL